MSKKYKLGVVGTPIEHSLSPFIHSRFSRNENINLEYLPYKVDDHSLSEFINDFFSDKSSKGLNITLPHKKRAAALDGVISKEAKYINSVNTITFNDRNLYLHSTDGIGFADDLVSKGLSLDQKNVCIIGAGAAVESILYVLAKNNVSLISIINRTQQNAERLIRKYSSMTNFQIETNETIKYDLIINGSSAGLTGKFKPPSDLLLLDKKTFFYDLNYSLAETPFCKWASRYSDNVYDGLGMLVHQAAHSFERWFNIFPDTDPVIQDLIKMRT